MGSNNRDEAWGSEVTPANFIEGKINEATRKAATRIRLTEECAARTGEKSEQIEGKPISGGENVRPYHGAGPEVRWDDAGKTVGQLKPLMQLLQLIRRSRKSTPRKDDQ